MKKRIALLPGDGIGPEVAESAADVLKSVAEQFGHEFEFENGLIGGAAIDAHQNPLPEETVALCERSDAIMLGAVGGPKWDQNPPELRPEKGLLGIRKKLGLFANLRPVTVFESLSEASPLKKEYISGVDFVIVRELTGGLYFGEPSRQYVNEAGEKEAVDTLFYKKEEIERVVREAFKMAAGRKGKVTSVDKANVLSSSRLWRETAEEIAKEFPDVTLEHMLVDNAAMQLIYAPSQFDVIVTENMFGDILSDEASMLTGSLGMLPSASLSSSGLHLFEPVHGSAPDIAGKGMANPFAAILSAAMLLRTSFGLENEAQAVEKAVAKVLADGSRTRDIARDGQYAGTHDITEKVKAALAGSNTKSIV
ncbi:3-isopropylmalate dehydrogenase [Bacillus velezensis]|uniref:3-isopropylmalate dehydrogenase n=1 Tax=Bacillus velezensis TaxID=492670 RepID=UPI0005CF3099|nr:3-isopropylmalate dehydrogenase [Bacillus velezensis]KJD59145.1 3-isopropylmalate dehydrogenase [Bacillus amyloliquefaciens]OQV49244.1 3-isopropylmalate dehydrogenase [Bacillus velezensis]WHM00909.1 3-isopropylmalate dehydrogenase [Bacillus velezensis]